MHGYISMFVIGKMQKHDGVFKDEKGKALFSFRLQTNNNKPLHCICRLQSVAETLAKIPENEIVIITQASGFYNKDGEFLAEVKEIITYDKDTFKKTSK